MEIYADLSELARLRELLQNTDESYGAIRTDLGGASHTMAAEWTGESQLAYGTSHEQWSSTQTEMQESLQKLVAHVEVSTRNYQAAIDANVKMWS